MTQTPPPGRGRRRILRVAAATLVLACAVGLGWAVGDRVTARRTEDALAASIITPAVTAPPAELAAAGAPLPLPVARSVAPMPSAAGLQAALGDALTAAGLGGRLVGTVVDVATGTVLLDRAAGQLAAPASTAKLATAAALLQVREPTDRIVTRSFAGAEPGQIVLVGGGDPTLSGAAPDQATAYAGAARLSDLAAAILGSGFGPITSIVVDASVFAGSTLGPGWDPADSPTSYAAPIEGLMIDGARATPTSVQRTGAPALAAGAALAVLLGHPGLPVAAGTAPPGAQLLAAVSSAPLLDLLEQMLQQSDNVLAEALARQVALATGAPASFEGASAATTSVLGALALPGLDAASLGLADASGLSTQERVAPAALAAILRAASDGAHPRLAPLIGGLPVAGWDGTLVDRYLVAGVPSTGSLPADPAAVAAAGVVRAKSGTLTGVSALAGVVVDTDGRELVFSLIADQVPDVGTDAAKRALDAIAGRLAACGCA